MSGGTPFPRTLRGTDGSGSTAAIPIEEKEEDRKMGRPGGMKQRALALMLCAGMTVTMAPVMPSVTAQAADPAPDISLHMWAKSRKWKALPGRTA